MTDEERDWFLEAPEDGGRILANDSRKTIIAKPAGSPFHPESIKDFEFIMKCVNDYQKARKLLQRAADKIPALDDDCLRGDSATDENGWLDQNARKIHEDIVTFLKENEDG